MEDNGKSQMIELLALRDDTGRPAIRGALKLVVRRLSTFPKGCWMSDERLNAETMDCDPSTFRRRMKYLEFIGVLRYDDVTLKGGRKVLARFLAHPEAGVVSEKEYRRGIPSLRTRPKPDIIAGIKVYSLSEYAALPDQYPFPSPDEEVKISDIC